MNKYKLAEFLTFTLGGFVIGGIISQILLFTDGQSFKRYDLIVIAPLFFIVLFYYLNKKNEI